MSVFGKAFRDRADAGRALAADLSAYADRDDVVVLGLPRGGVPVAYEVATALGAPLDVFVVRKLGVPGHRELAMGAIADGGTIVMNDDVVVAHGLGPAAIQAVVDAERAEIARRAKAYRDERPPIDVGGRVVIVVDDGLATGATMRVAVSALRANEMAPARILVGVPVGARATCEQLAGIADDVVCVERPKTFTAVGQWYDDFRPTADDQIRELLAAAEKSRGTGAP
jgi:predicted phosphoribosyltransferase